MYIKISLCTTEGMCPVKPYKFKERAYFEYRDVRQPYNVTLPHSSGPNPASEFTKIVYPVNNWCTCGNLSMLGCPTSGVVPSTLHPKPSHLPNHKTEISKQVIISGGYRVIASLNNFNTLLAYQDVIEAIHIPDTKNHPNIILSLKTDLLSLNLFTQINAWIDNLQLKEYIPFMKKHN